MKKCISLLFIALFLCTGCHKQATLELYVISADSVSEQTSNSDIASLALKEGRKVLSGEDFAGVDWEHQYFELKPDAVPSVGVVTAESGGSALLKTTDKDLFVWLLNGKAIYVGGFQMGNSNASTPRTPFIADKNRYVFEIRTDDKYGADKRFDKKLYAWFSDAGLLKSEIAEY